MVPLTEQTAYFLMLDEFTMIDGSAAFAHLFTEPAIIIRLASQRVGNLLTDLFIGTGPLP